MEVEVRFKGTEDNIGLTLDALDRLSERYNVEWEIVQK